MTTPEEKARERIDCQLNEAGWIVQNRDEIIARDKASLDIFWLRDESLEDSANLPDPDVIGTNNTELGSGLYSWCFIALTAYRGIGNTSTIQHAPLLMFSSSLNGFDARTVHPPGIRTVMMSHMGTDEPRDLIPGGYNAQKVAFVVYSLCVCIHAEKPKEVCSHDILL